MSLASFTQELDRLVSNFDRNKAFHSSKDFQESQLRVDFVSPLFEALGWDVSNRAGNPPHLREVVVESRVEEKGHRRRADYTFQVSGQPRLVVETKRPSEDLEDPKHILQLKKYAWNLQVRFAVLTNFLQTKIYAVPAPPVLTQPNEFLLEQVEFLQYLAKPDLLYGLLSKERVLEGALDKYFETIPKHKRDKAYQRSLFRLRGSKMVDDHFLDDLMEFRRDLARDIVQRNSRAGLTEPEVNEAVQRVIDRIVFLRIGEDRGIIYDPTLLDLVEKWGSKGSRVSFYPRLVEHFAGFNRPYNGLLFKPHSLSEGLDLSDEVLAGFIEKISVETSPYRFDVIPVEILGSIYERFLGSVVRITPARVKVEEKPEVRKAGGVYYTPKYIVDYIVGQTVGKLMDGRTPEQVAEIRVLDPACGSGSFLLGAFTRIMEYLAQWFHDHPKTNGSYKAWFDREEDGTVRLTSYAKRHILLNNLFGVDIDPQACEVTQLSLYLKLLEGESAASLREHQVKGHAEAFLPDLRNNIKCGNSLIGPEFEEDEQMSLLEGEARKRMNAFDWQAEFPKIMKRGGFDAVIGNPPWGADFTKPEGQYIHKLYRVAQGSTFDSYSVFIERAISLLKRHGLLGYITPDTFLRKDDHIETRRLLLQDNTVRELIEAGPLFSKVRDTWCLILTVSKTRPSIKNKIRHRKISRFIVSVESRLDKFARGVWDSEQEVPQSLWVKCSNFIVGYLASVSLQGIIGKIEKWPRLGEMSGRFHISRGEEGSKFALSEQSKGNFFMVIPRDVERYRLDEGMRISESSLTQTKVKSLYRHPKLWIIRIQKMRWERRLVCAFDERINSAGMKTLQVIVSSTDNEAELIFLSAILASTLINFWCTNYLADDMNQSYLEKIPIPTINYSNRTGKVKYNQIVKTAKRMLELQKQLAKAKSDHDKILLQRQISSTDRQINHLVYDLYGLTKDEIKLVEDNS